MNGYVCFYGNKRIEIYAETQLKARDEAAKQLKVPNKKKHMVSAVLAEINVDPETGQGTEVVHVADF